MRRVRTLSSTVAIVVAATACASALDARDAGGGGDATGEDVRGDAAARPPADNLPCDIREVVAARCAPCHSDPPVAGVPFRLADTADFLAPYFASTVRETAIVAVSEGRMPMAPATIEPAEREALLIWLRAGSPARAPGADCR